MRVASSVLAIVCVHVFVHVYKYFPTLCFSEDKSSHFVLCLCMPSQTCICTEIVESHPASHQAFQIHFHSTSFQMLLCTISISLSTHSLALVSGSLSARV